MSDTTARHWLLTLAGFLGLVSVAFGAYSEHALRPNIDAEYFRYLMTGIRYNQVHAVALLALALGLMAPLGSVALGRLKKAGWLMFVGTVLFSFSIYLAVWLDVMALTFITPVGGTLLMVAWGAVIWAAGRVELPSA